MPTLACILLQYVYNTGCPWLIKEVLAEAQRGRDR